MSFTIREYSQLNYERAKHINKRFSEMTSEVWCSRLAGEVGEFSLECLKADADGTRDNNFYYELCDCFGYLDLLSSTFGEYGIDLSGIITDHYGAPMAEEAMDPFNFSQLNDLFFKIYGNIIYNYGYNVPMVVNFSLILSISVGKLSNYIKKMYKAEERGLNHQELEYYTKSCNEIFNIYIALCFIANIYGIDFKQYLAKKFNLVSDKFGFKGKIDV